jgi:hypothetical protein
MKCRSYLKIAVNKQHTPQGIYLMRNYQTANFRTCSNLLNKSKIKHKYSSFRFCTAPPKNESNRVPAGDSNPAQGGYIPTKETFEDYRGESMLDAETAQKY